MHILQNARTSAEIQKYLDQNKGIAVVDCFATWCGPCKVIAPYVHQKHEKTQIPLITIDVDKSEELSKAYNIEAMPTFLVLKGTWNNVIKRIVGSGEHNVDLAYEAALSHKN